MQPSTAVFLCVSAILIGARAAEDRCFPKRFASSSVVCQCNATNCADIGPILPENGRVAVYRSSMDGLRFARDVVEFNDPTASPEETGAGSADLVMLLNANHTLQKIIGFGGAFTDAAAINWKLLEPALQNRLIQAYFGPDGLEYNMGRINMGGCDFSTRDYTYDDVEGDLALENFALAIEDTDYKIPMIHAANEAAAEKVLYFGSPWSPPAWMKKNGRTWGMGGMKGSPGGEYYRAWAQYFVKFYDAYRRANVDLWGFTIQNEPSTGFVPYGWQTMAMSPYTQRDFLKMDLGPALFNATDGNINIMVLDDNRIFLPWWANVILNDPDANRYAAGVGVHWYHDGFRSAKVLDSTAKAHPDKFILGTEACEGFQPFATSVILGRWERAESYASDILDDLRHSVAGWVDWNLCLNPTGGPNWVKNFVDAPIIVDADKKTFYKQPMYYALGHFTKFIPRGSYRLDDDLTTKDRRLSAVAFWRGDGLKSAVFLNTAKTEKTVRVVDEDGRRFEFKIGARSIASAIW